MFFRECNGHPSGCPGSVATWRDVLPKIGQTKVARHMSKHAMVVADVRGQRWLAEVSCNVQKETGLALPSAPDKWVAARCCGFLLVAHSFPADMFLSKEAVPVVCSQPSPDRLPSTAFTPFHGMP